MNTGLILYLYGLPSFYQVDVTSEVPYNGLVSNVVIEVTPMIIFASGFTFYVTFPREMPLPAEPVCAPGLLMSAVTCWTLPENQLKALLTFTSSPIAENTKFTFKLVGVNNPVSTQPTSPFTLIQAYNTLNDQVASLQTTGPVLTNSLPAETTGLIE